MDRMDYIQAVTRTRVLETRLLSRARIERMADAKDLDEVMKILGETEYIHVLGGLTRAHEYEKVLSSELARVYDLMYEISKDRIVVDLLALKYDYHNLKVLVKEKLLKKDFSNLYIKNGSMDIDKIKLDYLSNDYRDMDTRLKEIFEKVEEDYENKEDPQRIDILMDRYYFKHILELANETEIPLFISYAKDLIDFTNIKTLVRVKKQQKDINFLGEVVIPGGNIDSDEVVMGLNISLEEVIDKFRSYSMSPEICLGLEVYQEVGRLSEFEKLIDNYIMEQNKPSKYIHFGPEPIFSYIIAKETEVKILRIIMVSKLNKLSPDDIRERLRDLYV